MSRRLLMEYVGQTQDFWKVIAITFTKLLKLTASTRYRANQQSRTLVSVSHSGNSHDEYCLPSANSLMTN